MPSLPREVGNMEEKGGTGEKSKKEE